MGNTWEERGRNNAADAKYTENIYYETMWWWCNCSIIRFFGQSFSKGKTIKLTRWLWCVQLILFEAYGLAKFDIITYSRKISMELFINSFGLNNAQKSFICVHVYDFNKRKWLKSCGFSPLTIPSLWDQPRATLTSLIPRTSWNHLTTWQPPARIWCYSVYEINLMRPLQTDSVLGEVRF